MSKVREKLYIYGTGGLARLITEIVKSNKKYQIAGYIDDNKIKNNYNIKSVSSKYFFSNIKKANKMLEQSGLKLARKPTRPRTHLDLTISQTKCEEWKEYCYLV